MHAIRRVHTPRVTAMGAVTSLVIAIFSGAGAAPAWAEAGAISTFAGTGSFGYGGDGGPATAGDLNGPYGVAADSAGNVYIADQGNNVIRKVNPSGTISTVAGVGTPGFSGDGGPATAAELNGPGGVEVDSAGNLYINDTGNAVVRKVSVAGTIATVAGTPGNPGYSGDGGPATAAQLNSTYGALPIGGSLYIADYGNANIRKVDAGGTITTFAGDGSATTSGDGGSATAAGVPYPIGMAADPAGDIYIVQSREYAPNSRIRKVDTSGIITTWAGTGTPGYSGDGGPAVFAQFNAPTDIVFDASGNAYVSDYFNQAVRRIDPSGSIHTVAGGSPGYSGDGGPACLAQMNGPLGIALKPSGDLVVADNSNNVVRKVTGPVANCFAPVRGLTTDFDVDFEADIALYRPGSGTWFDHPSSGGADTSLQWGNASDVPTPGDYDGDYTPDQAVYRPSTGLWAIHESSGGNQFMTFGGSPGDVPVPADYDGDGKVDVAVFRPQYGFWYIHPSGGTADKAFMFGGGVSGDVPVPADFDGDGRADLAIFRPSGGTWFVSPSGTYGGDYATSYGSAGDVPLVGDFDADGKADVAIFRPSTGLWAIHHSFGSGDTFVTYGGVGGDVPVAADYDGDRKADVAIFRASLGAWYVHRSTNDTDGITTFGVSGDKAVVVPAATRLALFP